MTSIPPLQSWQVRRKLLMAMAAAFVITAPLAACGVEGGDEADSVTEQGPEGGDSGLLDLLPAASDLGDGWVEDSRGPAEGEEDDPDDPYLSALAEQCPDFHRLSEGFDAADDPGREKVEAEYSDPDGGFTAEFRVAEKSPTFTQENIDLVVEAANECEIEMKVTDTDYGTVTMVATSDDTYGDHGYKLQFQIEADTVELNQHLRQFVVGDLSTSMVIVDAQTSTGFEPADPTEVDGWAEIMETTLADHQG